MPYAQTSEHSYPATPTTPKFKWGCALYILMTTDDHSRVSSARPIESRIKDQDDVFSVVWIPSLGYETNSFISAKYRELASPMYTKGLFYKSNGWKIRHTRLRIIPHHSLFTRNDAFRMGIRLQNPCSMSQSMGNMHKEQVMNSHFLFLFFTRPSSPYCFPWI